MELILNNKNISLIKNKINLVYGETEFVLNIIQKLFFKYSDTERLNIGIVDKNSTMLNNITVYNNIILPLLYHKNLTETDAEIKIKKIYQMFDKKIDYELYPEKTSDDDKKIYSIIRALTLNPETVLIEEINTFSLDKLEFIIEKLIFLKKYIVFTTENSNMVDEIKRNFNNINYIKNEI
jgi:ABC-type lipoprotein export system ATPase subunit